MKNFCALILSVAFTALFLSMVIAETKDSVAVIVVDLQADFTTAHNGSLAVPNSDQPYLDKVAESTQQLKKAGLAILATQDWHPANHMSFATNHQGKKPFDTIRLATGKTQALWPPHCVQNTKGAQLLLNPALFSKVVPKGTDSSFDSYSGFQDDGGSRTELDKVLKDAGVKTIIVYGIATDYCVKATVLDGLRDGYNVVVISDLCRGVTDDTSKSALDEMKEKGAKIWPSLDLKKIKNL